ncbi:MAG: hypothetical protein HKN77_01745 [Woeseiaceae bacterium]|nr:hypothetical protein [Woeseiaceae bacterium]
MRNLKTLLACVLLSLPVAGWTAIDADGLPATSTWYFHADLGAMKKSKTANALYQWIDKEIFSEIRSEAGIDLSTQLQAITAFSSPANGAVMVVDGDILGDTRDKILAISSAAEVFETLESKGKTFYYIKGDNDFETKDIEVSGFDGEIFFSFAVNKKLLLTAKKDQMESLLANNGRFTGNKDHKGALFVLTAEKSLIQAGMDTDEFETDGGGFESNILRNTKQVALMIGEAADKLSIEALLITTEAKTAQSLASIVRGLVALQAFSEDMEPGVSEVLQSTRVDVDNNRLRVSAKISPETITAALD